jgi:Na+-translocating ferredoxin:NAD+ oxidoreductase RNF subunit RnfB
MGLAVLPVVIALALVAALTITLSSILGLASRRLHVEEDPRVDEVEALLPSTNCGACGFPGCRAFATALVAGDALPASCTVSSAEGRTAIASYLGVEVGSALRRIARLACAGGTNVARNRAHYEGLSSCAAADRVGGGGKGCSWGCLGFGDCAVVCTFDAITMGLHSLPVVAPDRCTACGDCVVACPKSLFSLEPETRKLWVACKSREAGERALLDCELACDACGRCAKDSDGSIHMEDNLPVVDEAKPQLRKAIERCPTGAIVWLEPDGVPTRGSAAAKISRNQPRPDAPT